MAATETEIRQWFLTEGLPLVVPARWRRRGLLRRVSPALAALGVLAAVGAVGYRVFDVSAATWERRNASAAWDLILLALAVAAMVLPGLAAWGVYRLLRTHQVWLATAGVLLVDVVAVPVLLPLLTDLSWLTTLVLAVATVLVVLASVYLGASSLAAWAVRYAVREVSAVAQTSGRLLPLLLLILVTFFTGELWQWAARVSRGRVWATVGLLALIGLTFIVTSLRDEVGVVQERRRRREPEPLDDTPFAGADLSRVAASPLTLAERGNVFGKLVFAQLIQVAVFSAAVMAVFVVLGTVMLPDAIVATWSGTTVSAGTLFGARLPVSQALLQMSLLLAALSGLYFAVNTSTDATYRRRFFDPLLRDVAVALAARDVYRDATRRAPAAGGAAE